MCKIKSTFLIVVLLGCAQISLAQGNGTPPDPSPSPFPNDFFDRISNGIGEQWDDAGTKLSASIFESLTDRELFKQTLIGDLNLSLRVQRKVYDNQDILDTWTVIDVMKLPLTLPVPLLSSELGFSTGTFGLSLGLNFGADAYSIRQINPKDWKNLSSLDELNLQARNAESLGDEINENADETGEVLHEENSDSSTLDGLTRFIFWRNQNPRIRARYNKLWHIITHPLQIPLSAKRMDQYNVGNVASYGLDGSVQLSANAGWSEFSIVGLEGLNTRAGLGISTYLRGRFSISLWKESEQFAQVKLSKRNDKGVTINVGSIEARPVLFEGFVILDKNVFKIQDSLIPFSIATNKNLSRQFDIGYRYDLYNEQAREAYNLATLGRFKKSGDLAEIEGSGVTKTITKDSRTRSQTDTYKMSLSLIFQKASSRSRANTRAKIEMDGKTHFLYSSEHTSYKAYDSLWGANEVKHHSFVTKLNESEYRQNPDTGLGMRIEGRIEDSHTSSKELFSYINELETAIGKPGSLPRPPKYFPTISCEEMESVLNTNIRENTCKNEGDNEKKLARYGRTSFIYQVDLNLAHLKHVQNVSKKELWQALEKAFNVKKGRWSNPWRRSFSLFINAPFTALNIPLSLANVNLDAGGRLIVAYRFARAWKKLKEIKKPRLLVNAFGELFRTIHYSPELVKVMRMLAGPTKARYFFTAKADTVWGQVSDGGDGLGPIFPISDEARDRVNFDRIGPRINVDKEAVVTTLDYKEISKDEVKISFTLKGLPTYLYLRVDKAPSWGRYQNLLRMIIKNNGQFKKGLNTIVLKREKSEGYLKKLAQAFFNGHYSTFSLAYSLDETNYGSVSSIRFRLRDPGEMEDSNYLTLDKAKGQDGIDQFEDAL